MSKQPNKIIIYGSSGHAVSVYGLCQSLGIDVVGFADNHTQESKKLQGLPVRTLNDFDDALPVVIAIGNPVIRRHVHETLVLERLCNPLIHKKASVDKSVVIGKGSVVMAGACVNINCRIGRNVIINTNSTIDHGCNIKDYGHICPGATLAGDVVVHEQAWVGLNSSIIQGLEVEKLAYVAAGCVVTDNVPSGSLVTGVPGKYKKDFLWGS